jgi:hypothetical protein
MKLAQDFGGIQEDQIFDLDSTSLSSRGEVIKEELEKLFNVDENFTN